MIERDHKPITHQPAPFSGRFFRLGRRSFCTRKFIPLLCVSTITISLIFISVFSSARIRNASQGYPTDF